MNEKLHINLAVTLSTQWHSLNFPIFIIIFYAGIRLQLQPVCLYIICCKIWQINTQRRKKEETRTKIKTNNLLLCSTKKRKNKFTSTVLPLVRFKCVCACGSACSMTDADMCRAGLSFLVARGLLLLSCVVLCAHAQLLCVWICCRISSSVRPSTVTGHLLLFISAASPACSDDFTASSHTLTHTFGTREEPKPLSGDDM